MEASEQAEVAAAALNPPANDPPVPKAAVEMELAPRQSLTVESAVQRKHSEPQGSPIRLSVSTTNLPVIAVAGDAVSADAPPLKRQSSLPDLSYPTLAHMGSLADVGLGLMPPDRSKSTSMSCIVPGEAAYRERASSRLRGLLRDPCILLDVLLTTDAPGTHKLTIGIVEAKDLRAHMMTPLEDPYVELNLHLNSHSQKGSRTRGGIVPRQSSSPFVQYAPPRDAAARQHQPSTTPVPREGSIPIVTVNGTPASETVTENGATAAEPLSSEKSRMSIPLKEGDGPSRPRSNSYAEAMSPRARGSAIDAVRRGTASSSSGVGTSDTASEGDTRPEIVWKETVELSWSDAEIANVPHSVTGAISHAVSDRFAGLSRQHPYLQLSLFNGDGEFFGDVVIRLKELETGVRVVQWHTLRRRKTSSGFSRLVSGAGKKTNRLGFHDGHTGHMLVNEDPRAERGRCTKVISLRTAVTIMVAVQLAVAVTIAVAVTYTAAFNQVVNVGKQLMANIGEAISQEIESVFIPPLVSVIDATSPLMLLQTNGTLDSSTAFPTIEHVFGYAFFTSSAFSVMTQMYVGTPQGTFVSVGVVPNNGPQYVSSVTPLNTTLRNIYGLNYACPLLDPRCRLANLTNVLVANDTYNVLSRPWYRAGALAAANNKTTAFFTEPYQFAFDNQLGITAVNPYLDPITGSLVGVVGVDTVLQEINDFMASINYLGNGYAYIVEVNSGYLLANSINAPLTYPNGERVFAQLSPNPLISFTANSVKDRVCVNINLTWITCDKSNQTLALKDNFINIRWLKYPYYVPLVVIVVIPTSDFTSDLEQALKIVGGVSAGIFVFSILTAILIVNLITRQLTRTTKRLSEFARLNFSGGVGERDLNSALKEVSRVSYALLHMRASLRSFSKYVPYEVVQFLADMNLEATLGGDRRVISIFFSDIKDFTSISEMLDLEVLIDLIGEYLEEMSQIIARHSGLVDKYIGDAIMALWNVPTELVDHPLYACAAALECHARLEELQTEWGRRGLPEIRARIGIHTGEAIVGNFGAKKRLNYTAIGDSVNLASRLEGLNKPYGTELMVSDETYAHISHKYLCRPLDVVAVKGKSTPSTVYELIGSLDGATPAQVDAARDFDRAFKAMLARDFKGAREAFEGYLATHVGDIPATMHRDACAEYEQHPPGDEWRGVRVMHEK